MAVDLVQERRRAHTYLDRLPPEQLSAVRGLLETMLDPVSRALANAPIEDEEISAEEERAVAEGREWLKHNKPIPHDEVLAEFGLTLEDFDRMGRTPLPPEENGAGVGERVMPIDSVKQAEELAQIFFDLSSAVDDFRIRNYSALTPAEQRQLKVQAQALDTRGQQYTADALGAILQGIQPHLRNIKQATQDAQDALADLNDVVKAITIVNSAVALVGSIVPGDLGSIGDNVQSLLQAIKG